MIDANDTISDNSQREQRYSHHQTKKKLKAEAMRKAELDIKTIEERKASGQVPKRRKNTEDLEILVVMCGRCSSKKRLMVKHMLNVNFVYL